MGGLKSLIYNIKIFLNCQLNIGSETRLSKNILIQKGEIQCFQLSFFVVESCEFMTPCPFYPNTAYRFYPLTYFNVALKICFKPQTSK